MCLSALCALHLCPLPLRCKIALISRYQDLGLSVLKTVIFWKKNYHGKHHKVQHYETGNSFPGSVSSCLKVLGCFLQQHPDWCQKKDNIPHPSGGKASKSDASALMTSVQWRGMNLCSQMLHRVTQRTQYPWSPTYFDASSCLLILEWEVLSGLNKTKDSGSPGGFNCKWSLPQTFKKLAFPQKNLFVYF